MNRKTKGRLGEVKAPAELIERDYEVYLPFNDNAKYDILAYKDGKVHRVSVKYTSYQLPSGSWSVTMKNVSRRNNGEVAVANFNKDEYDLIAVYIAPEDRVVLVSADKAGVASLTIKQEHGTTTVRHFDEAGWTQLQKDAIVKAPVTSA